MYEFENPNKKECSSVRKGKTGSRPVVSVAPRSRTEEHTYNRNSTMQVHELRYTPKSCKNSRNADKILQMKLGEGEKWFDKLSEEEQNALLRLERETDSAPLESEHIGAFSAYVGGSYQNINKYLRDTYGLSRAKWDKELAKNKRYKGNAGPQNKENDERAIANMRNAYDHAPQIEKPITVYRGCSRFLLGEDEKDNLLKGSPDADSLVGKNFVEPGFLSTSAREDYAQKFADKGGVMLSIHIPEGTRAFYVTAKLEGRPRSSKLRDEDEIIFAPGQRMRINEVKIKKGSGMPFYRIDASLL